MFSINRRERCIVSVMYRSPPPRIGAIRPLPSRFLSTNSGGFHGAVRPRSVSRKRWHAQRLTNVSEGPVQRSNWSWGELEIYVDEWFTAWFTADSRILIDHLFHALFKGEISDSFAKSVLKRRKYIYITLPDSIEKKKTVTRSYLRRFMIVIIFRRVWVNHSVLFQFFFVIINKEDWTLKNVKIKRVVSFLVALKNSFNSLRFLIYQFIDR